jgi:hypothetical protein
MKNLKNISAKVEISDLENLGWDFTNIYEEVSDAQSISLEDAEKFEKENYHVKLKVDAKGNLTYALCQNAEYGNEEFEQGDCGDNEAGLNDLKALIDSGKVWDLKQY